MNDGTAIAGRIAIGMIVHRISSRVLWVVREGTGLARALKRTMQMSRSTSTNIVIAVMIQSRKSWNQMMLSITGVADCCKPSCQSEGRPSPAQRRARRRASMARIVTANAVNRFDTSIAGSFDEMRLCRACAAPQAATRRPMPATRSAAATGGLLGERAAGPQGESQCSKTTISGRSQCTLGYLPCDLWPAIASPTAPQGLRDLVSLFRP